MKKEFFLYVLIVVTSFIYSGCNDSDSDYVQYWYSFATFIEDENEGYHFDLDSGGKLIPTNNGEVSGVDDSSRVIVTYSINSELGEGNDKIVNGDISTIDAILTKDILQLTEEIADSIGNDKVFTSENDIWMTDRHLNIIFRHYAYDKNHYINLTKPIGEQTDENGNQILEFRHNANDDLDLNVYKGVVSFSMDSLYEQGMDSVNFVMVAVEGDTNNFMYYDTFYFNTNNLKSAPAGINIERNFMIE